MKIWQEFLFLFIWGKRCNRVNATAKRKILIPCPEFCQTLNLLKDFLGPHLWFTFRQAEFYCGALREIPSAISNALGDPISSPDPAIKHHSLMACTCLDFSENTEHFKGYRQLQSGNWIKLSVPISCATVVNSWMCWVQQYQF